MCHTIKRTIKLAISCAFWLGEWLWQNSKQLAGTKTSKNAVVLYYHAVTDEQRQRFARQMDDLLKLATPVRADTTDSPEHKAHRVAVTFDDGFQCIFRNALPELLKRAIPVSIFVPTTSLGKEPAWIENEELRRKAGKVVDADTLRAFNNGMVCFGSHSVTHPNFLKLDVSEAWRELNDSKYELESILGTPVILFSFPHGIHNPAVVELGRKCGYRRLFTVEPTLAFTSQDELLTGRVNVDPNDWRIEFRLKLLGAYRWMALVSKAKKTLRQFFTTKIDEHLPEVESAEPAYRIEVDQIDESAWSLHLADFTDASIYQTWAYGAVRWGGKNLSHLVVKKNNRVVAMAQFRIVKVPALGVGIAYARWGPLWRLRGHDHDPGILRSILDAMREEYATKRKLVLRILPNEIKHRDDDVAKIYAAAGYKWIKDSYRTILLDLSPPLETLKQHLTSRWRRQLNIATGKELNIVEGTSDNLFAAFERLYHEMVGRKKYVPGMNPPEFRMMQNRLSLGQKMKIMVCEHSNEPVAAIICSAIGDTSIYLLGATGDNGLDLRGSYLLHWKMIERLKALGALGYDLNGYNPEKNPGTAAFKEGFRGKETHYIGQYEACASRARRFLVRSAERILKRPESLLQHIARSGSSD